MFMCRIDIQTNTRRFQSLFRVSIFHLSTTLADECHKFVLMIFLVTFCAAMHFQYLLEEVVLEPSRLSKIPVQVRRLCPYTF